MKIFEKVISLNVLKKIREIVVPKLDKYEKINKYINLIIEKQSFKHFQNCTRFSLYLQITKPGSIILY